MREYTLEKVYDPRFSRLSQLLAYWNTHRPARQKFPNLLEPESGRAIDIPDFSGNSPHDIWASIVAAIQITLKGYPEADRKAWILRNRGDRSRDQKAIIEIAALLSVSPGRIKRTIRRINEDLTQECRRRWLIPWEIEKNYNGPIINRDRIVIATISGEAMALGLNKVMIEPSQDGRNYDLVGYSPADRESNTIAISPKEGALVATQKEISKKFSARD